MALWNILFFDKVLPIGGLYEIGEVQTNCDRLLIYKTEDYYGDAQVVLPLKEWHMETHLRVWFDVVTNGILTTEMLAWVRPMPKEIPALLKDLQRRYRHTPMMPGVQEVILAQMNAAMASYVVQEPFEYMLARVQGHWERLHMDWHRALSTLPKGLDLPARNDNYGFMAQLS